MAPVRQGLSAAGLQSCRPSRVRFLSVTDLRVLHLACAGTCQHSQVLLSVCPAELQALQSALSAEELQAKGEQLQEQLAGKQAKLAALKSGKDLITKEQSNKVEKVRQCAGEALVWYR